MVINNLESMFDTCSNFVKTLLRKYNSIEKQKNWISESVCAFLARQDSYFVKDFYDMNSVYSQSKKDVKK